MRHLIKNWRTTVSGVLVIGAAAVLYIKGNTDTAAALFTTGIGLISAKDGVE